MPQHKQLSRGLLVALEGIDGSGKTTLAHNLFSLLKEDNFDAILTKEPGATALGSHIREIIHHQTIPLSPHAQYLLFAADRAQHFSEIIIPNLNAKKLIISDRMADSSLAYQCYGNKLDLTMVRSINNWAMNNITPDITIFVRIPVSIAIERIKNRGNVSAYEKCETFLHNVAQGFETLYKNRNDVIIIDGTQKIEITQSQAYDAIKQWIQINYPLI